MVLFFVIIIIESYGYLPRPKAAHNLVEPYAQPHTQAS